jgi:hypothetical protein
MAGRQVTMNEIVEVVYQGHRGAGFNTIGRSWDLIDKRCVSMWLWRDGWVSREEGRFQRRPSWLGSTGKAVRGFKEARRRL